MAGAGQFTVNIEDDLGITKQFSELLSEEGGHGISTVRNVAPLDCDAPCSRPSAAATGLAPAANLNLNVGLHRSSRAVEHTIDGWGPNALWMRAKRKVGLA